MKSILGEPHHLPEIMDIEAGLQQYISPVSLERHQELMADPNIEYWLLQKSDLIDGYLILKGVQSKNKVLDIKQMVVKNPDKGLGRCFLRWAKRYAFESHFYNVLSLDVFTDNFRAQTLYLSEGFRYEGHLRRRYEDRDVFQLSMTRDEYETAIPRLQEQIYLESDRAYLRPLRSDDWIALQHIAQHPDLWGYGSANLIDGQSVQAYCAKALTMRIQGTAYPFFIFDKQANQAAGSSRFCNIQLQHKRLEIGYTWLGQPFHRTGLNTHIKFLMLQFAFEQLGVNRVELKTDTRNLRSRKAILKIGASEEGTLRKHTINVDGYVRDTIYFSILREEWPTIKSNLSSRL
ncbi:MAG: GNAT family N-acetyltransferase [Bacteroidota bacterium]